jgi:hypothetical protein
MDIKLVTHFSILSLLILSISATLHDYEISRGRKMWQGNQRAVHYVDQFGLLTDKMENIQGLLTTFIPLSGGIDWSLSFELQFFGEAKDNKNGFYLGLSEEKFDSFEMNKKVYSKRDFLKVIPKKLGFFMFIKGTEDGKLYSGYKNDKKAFSNKDYSSCDVDFSKGKVLFFLKGGAGKIVVSYHYENDRDFQKCVDLSYDQKKLQVFYPILYARSVPKSPFRIKLSAMTFSTHVDNPNISENESKFDDHLPKLFKHIAFLKNNSDYLKTFRKETTDENLNITELFDSQIRVYNSLNYANILLSQCLSETDVIMDYTSRQKEASKDYGHMVINTLQEWMDKTAEQYKTMNDDVHNIIQEMDKFNFGSLVNETKKLFEDFKTKINDTPNSLGDFKKFGEVIQRNLEQLRKKKEIMKNFPQFVEEFLNKKKSQAGSSVSVTLSSLMGFLGFITILILCFIWYKLSSQKTSF